MFLKSKRTTHCTSNEIVSDFNTVNKFKIHSFSLFSQTDVNLLIYSLLAATFFFFFSKSISTSSFIKVLLLFFLKKSDVLHLRRKSKLLIVREKLYWQQIMGGI